MRVKLKPDKGRYAMDKELILDMLDTLKRLCSQIDDKRAVLKAAVMNKIENIVKEVEQG